MSSEMLTQPFDQSFNVMSNFYPQHNHSFIENGEDSMYYFGYPSMDPTSEDFRAAFYNPFEIKHRRRTSRAQLKVLEKSFEENPKPNATVRRILAQQLDMTPRGVQIWFQNRRAKAKLQKKKSGEIEEQSEDHQQTSPALFNQFFDNLKNWDNNARSIATAAAASCIMESTPLMNDTQLFSTTDQSEAMKMEDWFKMPIHPLAPVIDSGNDFDLSSSHLFNADDWRRKSCPALMPKDLQQKSFDISQQSLYLSYSKPTNLGYHLDTRRMTADDITRYKTPESECNTPQWNKAALTPNINSIDMYSPMSQQLTPMLSTGSPISSAEGAYYDSCLDMLITTTPSEISNL